jgi:hypothetical protein
MEDKMNPVRPVKRRHFGIVPVFLGSLFLFVGTAFPLSASETSMRGNYPACQLACLSEHTNKVRIICDGYVKEKNIEHFHNSMDIAVAKYVECHQQCKMVLPVK